MKSSESLKSCLWQSKYLLYKKKKFYYWILINRMTNLHRNIKEKYGQEAIQHLCLWEKRVIKASDFRNHRIFMLKCIGQNLMPVSIRLKPLKSKHFISANARRIIERAERQLMQERVRTINNTIQVNEENGNYNKTRLASIVTQVDLDR